MSLTPWYFLIYQIKAQEYPQFGESYHLMWREFIQDMRGINVTLDPLILL